MQRVNFNGVIISEKSLEVQDFYRGIRFGDSIFESIKISNSTILLAERHFNRLRTGGKAFKLQNKIFEDFDSFTTQIDALTNNTGIFNGKIRFTVLRSGEGLYSPETNEAHYLIEISPLNSSHFITEYIHNLSIYNDIPKHYSKLTEIKSSQNIIHVLAGIQAKDEGSGECLIINTGGNIAEGISSNVFAIYDRTLITPGLSEACLPGIMRSKVIETALKLNFIVKESVLGIDDILHADEVFFTNMIKGIRPLTHFRGKDFSSHYSLQLLEVINKELIGF
jgi:branched-chain amino acid aminotransferase